MERIDLVLLDSDVASRLSGYFRDGDRMSSSNLESLRQSHAELDIIVAALDGDGADYFRELRAIVAGILRQHGV